MCLVLSVLKSLSSSVKGNFQWTFFLGVALLTPLLKLLYRLPPVFGKVKLAKIFFKIGGIIPDIGVCSDALEKRGCFGAKAPEWALGNPSVLRLSQTCFEGLPVLPRPNFQFSEWSCSGFVLLSFSNHATLGSNRTSVGCSAQLSPVLVSADRHYFSNNT